MIRRCGLLAGALAAAVIALGAGELLLRQSPPASTDGSAVVLGPAGSVPQAAPAEPPSPSRGAAPTVTVVGTPADASSLVRSLLAAGLHAGVSIALMPGKLWPVTVPTVLYRPAEGAAASAVADVLSTRLPDTKLVPMPRTTDTSSSVVVLLPAAR